MQGEAAPREFEVYCHACNVTFAVETKRCVHCGGRLARGGRPSTLHRIAMRHPEPMATPEPEHQQLENILVEEEQTSGRPKLPISPITLLWVVLIAGSVAQRACQGG